MRVLEINTEKSWRGGERQTIYNIRGFLQEGLDVELMCRAKFPLSIQASNLHIPIHQVDGPSSAISFLIVNGKNYDVIHAQTAKAQFYAVLTKIFHRRPIVYSRRVDFLQSGFLTKMKYNLTDQTVAISKAIKNIVNAFGVQDVIVISDAVEYINPDAERAKKFIQENEFSGKKIIATTAAFVQHKDPLTMVRAIHELSKSRNDFVFLHFGSGILESDVRNEIEKLGISKYYKVMGFIENVEDMFSVFDVFTMSSEEEGLGSSVLDAFIYKVPVATTNAGGLKEIGDGRALVSAIKNPKELALNINRLLNDAQLRNDLKEKAYHYAGEQHSIEKIAKEYKVVFEKVAK